MPSFTTSQPPEYSTATAAEPRARLTPDERRAAIIEATIPLLRDHGLQVTTRQIADAAGVAEGTLFRVFDDKRALMIAAIAQALDPGPLVGALGDIHHEDLSSLLHEIVDVVGARAESIHRLLAIAYDVRLPAHEGAPAATPAARRSDAAHASAGEPARPGSARHAASELHRRSRAPEGIVTAIAELLTPHSEEFRRDPGVCARILFSIITSAHHSTLDPNEHLTSHEIVEFFLDGMRARPTTSENPC